MKNTITNVVMNRRQFFNLSLPATGGVILSNSLLNAQAFAEISRPFLGGNSFDRYDLVINGAGLCGYFAALHAANQGKRVLLVEKRPGPGFDLSFKSRLWIDANGMEMLSPKLTNLLFPVEELPEIKNRNATGPYKSKLGDDLALFSGTIRKGMLRNLMVAKADVLLMTDVCGLFQEKGHVTGALLAGKHGVFAVNCKNFIDASDKLLFTRRIIGEDFTVNRAGFVLELNKVTGPSPRQIQVPHSLGLYQNRIFLNPGKLSDNQAFLSFEFAAGMVDLDSVEHKARILAGEIGAQLKTLDPAFAKAQIYQYAYETSLDLQNNTPPKTKLLGHHLLTCAKSIISCADLKFTEEMSIGLVDNLRVPAGIGHSETLVLPGAQVSVKHVVFEEIDEPGYIVPLRRVKFDWKKVIGQRQTQVIVAGGGTSGSFATVGALEKGADAIVVDYFNDLGGTKTMGGVMAYYHGIRSHPFFKKQNEEAEALAFAANMNNKIGRKLYHLQSILNRGGKFVTSAILCGTLTEGHRVTGVLVCRHGQLERIEGTVTIDATGDGDVAAFAGATFQLGDSRIGLTQNYSQWDVAGVGKLPSNTNRDYDIINNTKISEQQRGLLISHYEAHFYDFHPYLTVRESRRIESLRNLDLIDCVEGTHFDDVVTLASSNFDLHGIGSSEFTRCGFLLPKSNNLTVEVPYRAIIPKTLDGLLMTGRCYGQTHNALQFTRMSADLLVLGYQTGQIAAELIWKGVQPRNYDVRELQKGWTSLGYLPLAYQTKSVGDQRGNRQEIERRVQELENGNKEYLFECSRIDKQMILPLLQERFKTATQKSGKLQIAKMLAWFGDSLGTELVAEELKELFIQETKQGYPGGYVEDYDFIRDRKINVLEGLFWRINQNIGLLAMSGDRSAAPIIRHILENTSSGGTMPARANDYYNDRMDLKTVPFHNRILNLCLYAERVPDKSLIPGFEELLKDEKIRGFVTTAYDRVRWRVYGGSLELGIAAALARCGGKKGYFLLKDYLNDLHFDFKHFASSELKELTQKNFEYGAIEWQKYLSRLSYPRPCMPLKKKVEV
jgi:hypothetical protein